MQYLFALTLLLAPTYAVRFNLLGLPTNFLMMWLFLLWVFFFAWIAYTGKIVSFMRWLRSELFTVHCSLLIVFLLAGTISLLVGGVSQEKFGQFIVLFLQPIGTFIIVRFLGSVRNWKLEIGNLLTQAALLFVSVAGLYAIIQYFTLWGIPQAWWGNAQEPKRAVAFFLHPNFYALFVTPLLAFLLPLVVTSDRSQVIGRMKPSLYTRHFTLVTRAAWLLGAVGLLLSLSRGGWLGLVVAVSVYVLVAGNRKLVVRMAAVGVVAVLIIAVVPNFRYRVLLPFRGEKSSVARLSLWQTGWRMVEDSPILGKGLLGFSNNWARYNADPGLEHYPAPHNIVLNFWVDTGLLGLVSFFGLMVLALKRAWKDRNNQLVFGLALACVAIMVHGIVDIPYFKNDLALVFWLLYALG